MKHDRIDFIIIGAQKGGTTSLFEILASHEDVKMSKIKELNFFTEIKDLTTDKLGRYHKNFEWQNGKICGEASTRYTQYPLYNDPAAQIYKYNPEMKLIYIIRDPVERIVSQYSFYQIQGLAKLPFLEEIYANEEYLATGRYFYQMGHFRKYFKTEQILVLFFEDLIKNISNIRKRLATFLDIDLNKFGSERIHKNISEGIFYKTPLIRKIQRSPLYRPLNFLIRNKVRDQLKSLFYKKAKKEIISDELNEKLIEYYREDIEKMAAFTSRDLSSWYINKREKLRQ